MARKRLRGSINQIRRRDENVFTMPRAARGKNKPKWVTLKTTGLKPNTKYKVMLDNHPGNQFEDITSFSKPMGKSVKNNTHREGNRGLTTYLKSDANGKLEIKTRPFGTDDATVSGTKSNGSKDFTKMWKFWHTRTQKNDLGRDKIKLIAYSSVNNPDSSNKIKTLKKTIAPPVVVEDGGTSTTVVNPPPRPEDALPPGIICDCLLPDVGMIDPIVPISTRSNYYQTFFIDALKVDGSDTVDLLDVVLYIRSKPIIKQNASGLANPGINISILQCESDGTPIITSRYAGSEVQLDYNQIKASPLATSGTVFTFKSPLRLKTNRFYAIAINLEDTNYALWMNQKGDLTLVDGVKTEERSQGSSKGHKGDVFYYDREKSKRKTAAASSWTPKNDLDIKFDVNIAEYTLSSVDVTLHNASYEFFNLSSTAATWEPGEEVYKVRTDELSNVYIAAGTNKIIGSNTNFTTLSDGDKLILTDNTDTTIQQVFTVDKSFAGSATIVYVEEYAERTIGGTSGSPAGTWFKSVVGEVEYYDYYFSNIRLSDSSVNYAQYDLDGNMRFAVGDTIKGIDSGTTGVIASYNPLPVSVFRSNWNAQLPPKFKPVTYYNLSEDLGAGIYKLHSNNKIFYLNAPNHIKDYAGWIISTSQEVDQANSGGTNFTGQMKSAEINLTYQYLGETDRSYSAPTIDLNEMDMVTHRWLINNDSTNEHLNKGNALTRHISTTLELGDGNNAEDIKVIMNAYRPRNTDIEVYAKIHNNADPDAFDDKQWTKLERTVGDDKFSKAGSLRDYKEMEFSFANTTATTLLSGTFTTTLNNNVITGFGHDLTNEITVDDVIKISSPLFPENYQLFAVDSFDNAAGTITLTENVSNNNIVGEGFEVSKLDAAQTAYRNPDNYNAVRYFNEAGSPYDTYNRVAIKIVLLASDRKLVPKVDDYRVIGVTA